METTTVFEQRVTLTPKDLNRVATSTIDALLLEKTEQVLEGKCTKNGYVIPGSLKMLSRSMGQIDAGRFTGAFVYFVQVEGHVLYPTDGMILRVEVVRKNKMGIFAEYNSAIRVMIPRDLHIGIEQYENINIGDKVSVLIKKSRFQVNDPFILSVGILYDTGIASVASVASEVAPDLGALNDADEASEEE
jgi:DNA-directed RNA polymerase subunit E'/Rpb7